MKRKIKWLMGGLLLLACIVCAWLIWGVVTSLQPVVMNYTVEADVTESIRIVQLTDLHSREYGEKNEELAEMVAAQEPDVIFMTGDMMSFRDENADVVCALIEELKDIAPVYYSYGNHETAWEKDRGESLRPALEGAGAIVLDTEYLDTELSGQAVRIGGYAGYYRQPGMFEVTAEERAAELAFADAFENTDRLKLLLCHIPTAWIDWGYINDFLVDVVFSGHYHGGQIRLPGIGGVYAPYIGFFPPYTKGVFEGGQAVCVLSAGVGTEQYIPRVNNPPEIVVVELTPPEK